jgi:hypothetical protein
LRVAQHPFDVARQHVRGLEHNVSRVANGYRKSYNDRESADCSHHDHPSPAN